MKKTLLIALWIVSVIGSTAFAAAPISPVVQVRTYDAIQWKYPQELWNGSASIISKKWLLVTNNHVAENADEENALWYIICLTMQQWKIPECNYTAHVIVRNTDLDMALLQLDSKDINGNTVDFSSLPVLDIDFSYAPVDSEKVQAIWYPGIWWSTLTTTNWTIAWTIKYNWFTYIKTDATIAPGNSGWPMISPAWKQIWLNTFGISSDAESLGYGLLMWEAKSFIDQYKDATAIIPQTKLDLWSYAKNIDQINKQGKIQFPWMSYTIPAWYEIKNIVDWISFMQTPKDQKDVQADAMKISISKTPTLQTEKEFFYYLESIWAYSKSYTKLVPTTISGKKFYKLVFSRDDTAGEWWWVQMYLWQLHKNAIVAIVMSIQWASEKKLAEVKAEKEMLLKSITFTDTNYIPSFDWKIVDPSITFTNPNDRVWDAVVQDWSQWAILNLYKYSNNLHDWLNISISKTTKATSIQKIYTTDLKDVAKNMKAMGKLQWKDAFITCSENNSNASSVDENNKPLQQFLCQISTIIPSLDDVPYRIDISIMWPRSTKEQFLQTMIESIPKDITLGNGITSLQNLFKKSIGAATFTDLRDQTSAYKKKLDTLAGYNLLRKSTTFAAYTPMTYGVFAEKYLLMVHNIVITNSSCTDSICLLKNKKVTVQGKDTTLFDLFSDVKINWNGYVDVNKAEFFSFYMQLKLAWVTLAVYSEEILNQIKNDPENPDYTSIYEAIDWYNAVKYGSRKIAYDETLWDDYSSYYKSFFKPTKMISFVPKKWIVTTSYYSDKPIIFDAGSVTSIQCTYSPQWSKCIDTDLGKTPGTYMILDKWTMIDMFIDMMDFGLFDTELAKKKDADVSDDTTGLDTEK